MLTSLSLENFKCFSTPQRIDLAPLTLLVGPNGSGKSTILHAILYLHDLLAHGNADVDCTTLGGSVTLLGGFSRFVHRHELHRTIVLRSEFDTPASLDRFGRDLTRFPLPDLDDDISSAWLELTIRRRTTPAFRGPLIDRAVIGVNGSPEPLVWLETGPSLRKGEPLLARINLGHPLLADSGPELAEAWRFIAIPEHALPPPARLGDPDDLDDEPAPHDTTAIDLERFDPALLPVFAIACPRVGALPPAHAQLRLLPFGAHEDTSNPDDPIIAALYQARTFLEMVVLGTTAQLAATLRSMLYLGPLRSVPPRGFLYERPDSSNSWADGLAAWDLLLADRSDLVARTNAWLGRLGAGGRVVVQQLFDPTAAAEDLSIRHSDRTARRVLVQTDGGALVLPCEAGASVSQIIPVIVTALHARTGLVEQPEPHVHPVHHDALGDLFVEAALRNAGRYPMLVETHSEPLIRRVLQHACFESDDERSAPTDMLSANQISVFHIEPGPDGARAHRWRIDESRDNEPTERWSTDPFAAHDRHRLDHEKQSDIRSSRSPSHASWAPPPTHP